MTAHPRSTTVKAMSRADRIAHLELELAVLRADARDDLIVTIARTTADYAFTARGLWRHRRLSTPLAHAVRALGIRSAVQLGRFLGRLHGQMVRGVTIECVGSGNAGRVWLARGAVKVDDTFTVPLA